MNFKKIINDKALICIFVALAASTLMLGSTLFLLDISRSSDDELRKFRIAKLTEPTAVSTIIIGDSSAGAALNSSLFSKLSDRSTKNLSLTVDDGIVGSYLMLEKALAVHPEIETVIIMQTADVWRKHFSSEAYFELTRRPDFWPGQTRFSSSTSLIDFMAYATDLHRPLRVINYAAKKVFNPQWRISVDPELEQVTQLPETFAGGQLQVEPSFRLSRTMEPVQISSFKMIDQLCARRSLRCVFLFGPIHEAVIKNSPAELAEIIHNVTEIAKHIKVIQTVLLLKNEQVGDTINHVLPAYKDKITEKIYRIIENDLASTDRK